MEINTDYKGLDQVQYEKALEYYNHDTLALDVWLEKYALRDKEGNLEEFHPADTFKRLSKTLSEYLPRKRFQSKRSWKRDKLELESSLFGDLYFKRFIFGGSILFGLGNPYVESSLGNCFVIHTPEDSYGGIMRTDEEQVQLMKRRGGVGHDISHLRPSGSPVNNAAKTSTGATSFMDRYSNSTREVAQEGRRGALMLTMDVEHPDIKEFITKKEDLTKVTGANISVKLTDSFMNKILEDDIEANEILDLISKQSWKTGEPGVLFWDTILEASPADLYPQFKTVSTNPCQPAHAIVACDGQLCTIGDLKVGSLIDTEHGQSAVVRKESAGIQKVYKYKTTYGSVLCTEDHQIIQNGMKVKAKDAISLDILCRLKWLDPSPEGWASMVSIMDGLLIGDGSVHKASNNLIHLYIGKNDSDYFTDRRIKDGILKHRKEIKDTAYEVIHSLSPEDLPLTYLRKVPDKYLFGPKKEMRGFLLGLFSANGSVTGGRITLKATSKVLVEQVQLMLNALGIKSYITINKAHNVKFSNGTYECRESYDLNIGRAADRDRFLDVVGFIQQYKRTKAYNTLGRHSYKFDPISKPIIDVEYMGEFEVFNITVDNPSHTYWSGGFNIANCGELPLSSYDSCRLGHINLNSLCERTIDGDYKFNFDKLIELTYRAQLYMDLIVSAEADRIKSIIATVKTNSKNEVCTEVELNLWNKILKNLLDGRRTGLGILGLSDAIVKLGYPYGTSDFNNVAKRIMRDISIASYKQSILMAKWWGSFKSCRYKIEKKGFQTKSNFLSLIRENLDNSTNIIWNIDGRRNIANLTIAPTGSVSLLCGTTSGMEPIYKIYHRRRRKVSVGEYNFVDKTGDKWLEYNVIHPDFVVWYKRKNKIRTIAEAKLELTGMSKENLDKIIEESPYKGSEAHDIPYMNKIHLQGLLQGYVDHSISMTLNLPNDTSPEVIKNIYVEAWLNGVKGMTIYRDGSRDGVLVTDTPTINKDFRHDAPKRPKNMPCDVHWVNSKDGNYIIIVGLYNEIPFEVFGAKFILVTPDSKLPEMKRMNLVKLQRGVYQLVDNKEVVISNITEAMTPGEEVITRLASMGLRHGADIKFIAEQLSKTKEELSSFSKILARILRKYIKTGDIVSGSLCPKCDEPLIHEGGCVHCSNCTYEVCG